MKLKTKTKPIFLHAEILRRDDAERVITAYAYVNETVRGEGGVRLTRAAMEAATPDYMTWANVRRMHQMDAVGIARSVVWDDRGALMEIEICDDDVWDKIQRAVYKAVSVGVVPTIMRGNDVTGCRWLETSIVDRPKDPESRFIAIRAEGAEALNPEAEFEAEVENEEAPATTDPAAAVTEERPDETPAAEDATIQRTEVADNAAASTDVPERENLDNKPAKVDKRKIRRLTRYSHSPGDECLHETRDGAYECASAINRGIGGGAIERSYTYTPDTFASLTESLEISDQVSDIERIVSALCNNLAYLVFTAEDSGAGVTGPDLSDLMHRSVDEFADYIHNWIDAEIAEDADDDIMRAALIQRVAGTKPTAKDGAPKSAPKGYPDDPKGYADPTNFRYAIDNADHVKAALSMWGKAKNQKPYSDAEREYVTAKILLAAKKFKIDASGAAIKRAAGETTETPEPVDATILFRGERVEPAIVLQRLEAAETELTTVRADLGSAKEQLVSLQRSIPAPVASPARNAELFTVERRFAANEDATGVQDQVQPLLLERAELLQPVAPEATTEERQSRASRLQVVDRALRSYGVTATQ